ncbi:uncharacterized protein BJ171DRAFT_512078 [Polychytrium aggregatum]|uniref:uncharacterized protein n=1 Tax=Polychytrium aggregatum TaxID=110093 RepID=UPI0022FEBB71|nr:uncharacterized protein BJ171DRAFT_512078 [Polychytrium aggregatum]KAI9202807.1 hypothetical protein BJ171DRAFT_512078 [Polychytrium aggregatum]
MPWIRETPVPIHEVYERPGHGDGHPAPAVGPVSHLTIEADGVDPTYYPTFDLMRYDQLASYSPLGSTFHLYDRASSAREYARADGSDSNHDAETEGSEQTTICVMSGYWHILGNRRTCLEIKTFPPPIVGDPDDQSIFLSSLSNQSIQIHLPEPALPDPALFYCKETQSILVHVVLASGELRRFQISVVEAQDVVLSELTPVVFDPALSDPGTKPRLPVLVSMPDVNQAWVSFSDGALLYLDIRNGLEAQVILQDSPNLMGKLTSLVPKLLQSKLYRQSSIQAAEIEEPDWPVSLVTEENLPVAVVLTREGRIRVWDAVQKRCLKSIQLEQELLTTVDESMQRICSFSKVSQEARYHMKAFDWIVDDNTGDQSFKLALLIPTAHSAAPILLVSQVQYTRGTADISPIHKSICHWDDDAGTTIADHLVDFFVVPSSCLGGNVLSAQPGDPTVVDRSWAICGAWERQCQSYARYTHIILTTAGPEVPSKHITPQRWISIWTRPRQLLDVPESEQRIQANDIDELFLKHLVASERFSTTVLHNVLEQYVEFYSVPLPDLIKIPLGRCITMAVHEAVKQATDLSPIDDQVLLEAAQIHHEELREKWGRFLAMCIELDIVENTPLGLGINPITGLVTMVKRGGFSILRMCDASEVLCLQQNAVSGGFDSSAFAMLAPSWLKRYPGLCSSQFRHNATVFFDVVDHVNQVVHPCDIKAFEEDVAYSLSSHDSVGMTISYVASLYSKHFHELARSPEDVNALLRELSGIEEFPVWYTEMIDLLGGKDALSTTSTPWQWPSFSDGQRSDMMQLIFVASQKQIIESRYELCRNFLVFLTVLKSQGHRLGLRFEVPKVTFLSTCVLFQSLYFLKWSGERRTRRSLPRRDEIGVEGRLQTLSLAGSHPEYQSDLVLAKIINYRLCHRDQPSASFEEGLFSEITAVVSARMAKLEILAPVSLRTSNVFKNTQEDQVRRGYFELLLPIWRLGEYELLSEGLKMVPFCGCTGVSAKGPGSGIMYLAGITKLELGEIERSKTYLERAVLSFDEASRKDLDMLHPGFAQSLNLEAYYEHIIRIYEQKKISDGVVHFVLLAMSIAVPEKMNRYRMRLFHEYLELLDFDAAYTALMSNTEPTSQKNCLERFVTKLCEHGEIEALCTKYSFSGLGTDVERFLKFKASTQVLGPDRRSDAVNSGEVPNYYRILYSYYVFRGDFRSAGLAMYENACALASIKLFQGSRLHEGPGAGDLSVRHRQSIQPSSVVTEKEITTLTRQQAECYLVAINILSLLEPSEAFLLVETKSSSLEDPCEWKVGANRKRQKILETDVNGQGSALDGKTTRMVTLQDLRQGYILTLAKLELSALPMTSYLASSTLPLRPQSAVDLYIHASQFDQAFSIAKLFDLDMKSIFENCARKCIKMAWAERNQTEIADEDYEILKERPASWEGTASRSAWRLLENYLRLHDRAEDGLVHRRAVVEVVLREDPSSMPVWLRDSFMTNRPEELLNAYLRNNLVEDAVRFATRYIAEYLRSAELRAGQTQQAELWLPYTTIDRVAASASVILQSHGGDSLDSLKALTERLTQALDGYLSFVGRESRA